MVGFGLPLSRALSGVLLMTALATAACGPQIRPARFGDPEPTPTAPRLPIAREAGGPIAVAPPTPTPGVRTVDRIAGPQGPRTVAAPGGVPGGAEPVSFRFQQTPLREAAAVVLGDALGRSFVIDEGIDDRISFETASPVARADVEGAFAAVLASRGLALREDGGVLRITRAAGAGSLAVRGPSTVFRLAHLPAQQAASLLDGTVGPGRAEAIGDGLLVVRGTQAETRRVADVLATLDVDALSGVSIVQVGLREARATEVVAELESIFGVDGQGPRATALRFVPLDRLGAVIVMSRSQTLLDRAQAVIQRLDRTRLAERRLYVFSLQNRRAADVLPSLQPLFAETRPAVATASTRVRDVAADEEETVISTGAAVSRSSDALGAADAAAPRLSIDEGRNALLVHGTAAQAQEVRELLRLLDTGAMQVLIEVTIIEVTLGEDLRYGVEYALRTGRIGRFADLGFVLSNGTDRTLPPQASAPGLGIIVGNRAGPEAVIEALAGVTDVRVVSSPKLIVQDNHQAQLQIGDSVPIIVQQSASASGFAVNGDRTSQVITNAVSYRDTGVLLRVTPRISNAGVVNLDIVQEVSDVVRTTTSTIDSPTIRRRNLSTRIAVRDGGTVVIGGLIQNRTSNEQSGIPLLKDLPLLGALFSTTSNSDARTELIALLAPQVITAPEDAEALTDRMRTTFRALIDRGAVRP